jgi:16S rRNA processing protein RimM
MTWNEMIVIGRIVRPQGNRGEVVVESLTDFGDERFRPGAVLFVGRDGRIDEAHVTSSREHDGRWVVGLAGVRTIDEAESLRGLELRIPPDQLRALEPGRHYVHDLVGCRVETMGGERAGDVQDVRLDTGVPLLVVNGESGELLVPFTEAICRSVDTAGRVIRIEPPEGLLEVNRTERRTEPGAGE